MTQQKQMPFCGLTLKMYSTGNQAPKMEYQASSNKAQFQCTLTKRMYGIFDIQRWLNSPEVQEYVKSGHMLKWGSKTEQGDANQFNNGMQLMVTCYMVKPFQKKGTNFAKPIGLTMPQMSQQARDPMDDQLPQSEVEWSKESPTDFNPDQYEQELG